MPLYKLPASSLPYYVSFFNRHALDGVIGAATIKGLLTKCGLKPTDCQVEKVISSVSLNPSGINCQAFIDLISNYHELSNPDTEYRAAFRLYDTNSSGRLSKTDVLTMFKQMRVSVDVDKLFEEADLDHNGFIEYDEFVALMDRA